MFDPIKEASEFTSFVMTNEQAQLLIAISIVGALISAFTSVAINYLTRQQA